MAVRTLVLALVATVALARGINQPGSDAASATLHPGARRGSETDEVTSLPGYDGNLPVKLHGGYITVDEERGRNLFYLFVESQRDPGKDPLVLWLNGGPGCSSFDGFVVEHGPFLMRFRGGKDPDGRVRQELQLTDNPHSWSQVANMLYVDSPAGVGMSYSDTKQDYHTNDTQTAADMHIFLRRWLEQFPQFQDNDFYVSGESFAGIYVPMVTRDVLRGNKRGQEPRINLKGYIVGNGVTDPRFDGNSLIPFVAGQSLISQSLHHEVKHACDGEYWNSKAGSRCDQLLDEVYRTVEGINMYDILEDCYRGHNPYHPKTGSTSTGGEVSGSKSNAAVVAAKGSRRGWPLLGGLTRTGLVPGFRQALLGSISAEQQQLGQEGASQLGHIPPCLDSREMWAFANNPEVRKAIHAKSIEEIGPFLECVNGDVIHYTHDVESMLPVHAELMDHGLRALIFSGDHDMAVPHTGSEAWTAAFAKDQGMEEKHSWRQWHVLDKQVAGYVVHWSGRRGGELLYVTVKGAGHMVPETKPVEALAMFERFLASGTVHLDKH